MLPISEIATILAVNFALCIAGFVLLWLIASAIKDVSFIDAFWAFGMGGLAVATWLQIGASTTRQLLLLALCWAWAARLGVHLFARWLTHGPDRRYVRMMEKAKAERGWGYAQASLRLVFLLQSPLMWTVALPVQLGMMQTNPAGIGWLGWTGAAISLFGTAFETLGDIQITRFKAHSPSVVSADTR